MTPNDFLVAYGGVLILPLSVIEGPIVSAVTGFLSAQDYFRWYWALGLLVCGDLTGDLIYYWLGRTGGGTLSGISRRLGLPATISPRLQADLRQNATKVLLAGKWTHSIGCFVLVGSGMLRLDLGHFLLVNLLATLPKSGLLFGLGYFAGDLTTVFERHFVLGTILLGMAGVGSIAVILRHADKIRAEP